MVITVIRWPHGEGLRAEGQGRVREAPAGPAEEAGLVPGVAGVGVRPGQVLRRRGGSGRTEHQPDQHPENGRCAGNLAKGVNVKMTIRYPSDGLSTVKDKILHTSRTARRPKTGL